MKSLALALVTALVAALVAVPARAQDRWDHGGQGHQDHRGDPDSHDRGPGFGDHRWDHREREGPRIGFGFGFGFGGPYPGPYPDAYPGAYPGAFPDAYPGFYPPGYPGTVWARPRAPAYTLVAPPPPAPAAPPPPDMAITPRRGQSAAQTEADRQDCNRFAVTQPAALADAQIFQNTVAACLDARGYAVR